MACTIILHGQKFSIAFARERSGECPGCRFFDALTTLDKAKLMALFQLAGEQGKFNNPEKFGDLGAGLYEFKSHQIRMPFGYSKKKRRMILITHGFVKKKNKTPKEEITRARRILKEDHADHGLAIGKKVK
jgi:phage-related protein